jgi:hypothetical protein
MKATRHAGGELQYVGAKNDVLFSSQNIKKLKKFILKPTMNLTYWN